MLSIKNRVNFEYNSMYDILYIKLDESDYSYGDEEINGIVVNFDYNTDKVIGADIWDFKLKMQRNESIPLPFDVDLKEIYNKLP